MAEEKNKRKKWPVAVGIAGVVVVAAAVTDTWGGVAEISADGRPKVEIPAKDLMLEPGDTVTVTIPDDTDYPVDVTAISFPWMRWKG